MSNEIKIPAVEFPDEGELESWRQAADDLLRGPANMHTMRKAAFKLQDAYLFASALAAAPAATPAFDVEQMLRDCVPGGDVCDPQQVADSLREWFAATHAAAEEPAPDPHAVRLARALDGLMEGSRFYAARRQAYWHTKAMPTTKALDEARMALEAYRAPTSASVAPATASVSGLVSALERIIDMNRQEAVDRDGRAAAAEAYACVRVAREAIAAYRAAPSAAAVQAEPAAYWIPATEQFSIAKPGEKPFAKAWQPLYAHPAATQPQATEREALSEERIDRVFSAFAGDNGNGVEYLKCYREGFRHIACALFEAAGINTKG